MELPVHELAYYDNIIYDLKKTGRVPVAFGCVEQQKPHFIYGVGKEFKYRLIVTYNEIRARQIYEDYRAMDRNTVYYPARDFIFYSADIHGNQLAKERLEAVHRLSEEPSLTVVTTIDGCMDKLMPPQVYERYTIRIVADDDIDVDELAEKLSLMGYERCAQVEFGGQFAVRGGIIDVYPLTAENPYRIELWDTQVDSIRSFDAESQRSIENVEDVTIFPAIELIPDDNMADAMESLEKRQRVCRTA